MEEAVSESIFRDHTGIEALFLTRDQKRNLGSSPPQPPQKTLRQSCDFNGPVLRPSGYRNVPAVFIRTESVDTPHKPHTIPICVLYLLHIAPM